MARNKHPEQTVKKILEVSRKLFLEKGYEETTILDIVDNLGGLTRGAFYHHFKSKEDVLNAIGDKQFEDNNPFLLLASEKDLNGLQKLRKLFIMQYANNDVQEFNEMAVPLLKNPKILAEFLRDNQETLVPLLAELVQEGMADGSIPQGNPRLISELLLLVTNVWSIPTIYPCSCKESLEKVMIIKTVFDSLGVPIFDDELVGYCVSMIDNAIGE